MSPASLLRPARSGLKLDQGQSVLLDANTPLLSLGLRVEVGLVRVYLPSPEGGEITIGFLQSGEGLNPETVLRDWVGLEALSAATLSTLSPADPLPKAGEGVSDWMLELLLIRHLNQCEQRLQALLTLLVLRLGRRNGAWYELPMRLTHERLAELIGSSRVTVTKMMSRWRETDLAEYGDGGSTGLRLAPALIESERLVA
jgi:CRP-like cAMP-binding protein